MTQLEQFRKQIDDFFHHHSQSPLDNQQKQNFRGLSYFPPNKDLILEVELEWLPPFDTLEIPTSSGETKQFRRLGKFSFAVNGTETQLTVLSNLDGHELFIPFRDATSGKESYGGGRYLDDHRPGVVEIGRNRYRIDFNYAYNPWCAYSPDFSCTLPPRENWLSIPIRAGEQAFAAHT